MYLLDTHALLWYLRDSPELSKKALKIISTEDEIFVSVASLWEIAIKNSIGKLDLEFSIEEIENLCNEKDITILQINGKQLDKIKLLPKIHSDPFDRLIIAQAQTEELTILTTDSKIPKYPVKTLW
ncbi:MAG: type II toxin-antitoxin system VapC family toxin [Treponema sp.]|jgi:PIN domain nuclease of toxin-antitoxin system|nr:type II toxin-antitoxin system VapC family toxin [Treponema sp.]